MTKEISIGYPHQRKSLKITFPGGIVSIGCGLTNRQGRDVTHVSVSADGDRYAGDPQYWAHWGEVDERGGGCRIVRAEKPEGLTAAQEAVLADLRAGNCPMLAACAEEHWRKGEPYYIDARVKVSKRLRAAFERANPKEKA